MLILVVSCCNICLAAVKLFKFCSVNFKKRKKIIQTLEKKNSESPVKFYVAFYEYTVKRNANISDSCQFKSLLVVVKTLLVKIVNVLGRC